MDICLGHFNVTLVTMFVYQVLYIIVYTTTTISCGIHVFPYVLVNILLLSSLYISGAVVVATKMGCTVLMEPTPPLLPNHMNIGPRISCNKVHGVLVNPYKRH